MCYESIIVLSTRSITFLASLWSFYALTNTGQDQNEQNKEVSTPTQVQPHAARQRKHDETYVGNATALLTLQPPLWAPFPRTSRSRHSHLTVSSSTHYGKRQAWPQKRRHPPRQRRRPNMDTLGWKNLRRTEICC